MLRKILFVDDDKILRFAVEKHLEIYSDHFTTITAIDGFDAVQKLKKIPFSLVVLDLIMPRMDGVSLVSHIRDNYPDIPIIVVSGMPIEKMNALVTAKGVVAYLSKPFQADELVSTIMSTLRKEAEGGIMHEVSPAVFLQLMEMDAKSCTIRILDKVSEQGGILYFIDGQLVDARINELKGIDAALSIFTWDTATIFLRNDCEPREDIINSGLQPIIMKAAGMKDESDKPEDPTKPESPGAVEGKKPSPSADSGELDDLVLPDDFPSPMLFDKAAAAPTSPQDGNGSEQDGSQIESLRNMLEKAAGVQCKRDDFQRSESIDKVIGNLTKLGAKLRFGNFQVGYIASGKSTDRILLPGQPNTAVNVQPDCPRDTIVELFRYGTGSPPI
jgi:CheY-like chemotaxis protein